MFNQKQTVYALFSDVLCMHSHASIRHAFWGVFIEDHFLSSVQHDVLFFMECLFGNRMSLRSSGDLAGLLHFWEIRFWNKSSRWFEGRRHVWCHFFFYMWGFVLSFWFQDRATAAPAAREQLVWHHLPHQGKKGGKLERKTHPVRFQKIVSGVVTGLAGRSLTLGPITQWGWLVPTCPPDVFIKLFISPLKQFYNYGSLVPKISIFPNFGHANPTTPLEIELYFSFECT